MAVFGAGPAGLHAAEELVRRDRLDVRVGLMDRLPTPYGLVRYGIHPVDLDWDHIDSAERALGATRDRARTKIDDWPTLLWLGRAPRPVRGPAPPPSPGPALDPEELPWPS